MAILITGGTGFVGSHLARRLVQEGEDKLVLFDLFPNPKSVADIAEHVEIIQGDFSEPGELMAVFKKHDISHVFHLAYILRDSETFPAVSAIRINCAGTTNVFEMSQMAGVQRVIWASSVVVYGRVMSSDKIKLLDESASLRPEGIYDACKIFNETIAEIYALRRGFDHICIRLESTYGLGRAQRRGLGHDIYSIVEQAAQGKPATLPPLDHLVTWSYVEDAARAFCCAYKAGKTKSRIFNFAGEIRPVRDAVDYLRCLFPDAHFTIGTEAMKVVAYLNTDRIRKELGFVTEYSMEKGMKEYADGLAKAANQ